MNIEKIFKLFKHFIGAYMDFLENKEIYWETDNLYSKIDSIIVTQKYPLLSQDYIATYYDTRFI